VFAPAALAPKFSKLSPAQNVKQLFSLGGVSRLLKSLVPLAVILYLTVVIVVAEWPAI